MDANRVRRSFISQMRAFREDLHELDRDTFDAEVRDELVARLAKLTDELNDFCKHLIGEQAP